MVLRSAVLASCLALSSISIAGAKPADGQGVPEGATLRVEVANSDGNPIAGPIYVAVVAAENAWREPTREAAVPPGSRTPDWTIPAGIYRVVCNSPGHEVVFSPAIDLTAGESRVEHCSLRPFVELSGSVRTGDGRPVRGAIVGLPHAFVEEFALKLSPLGERFTQGDRSTRSDQWGNFRILGLPTFKSPIWIQADGYSPAYLGDVLFPAGGGKIEPIQLAPGAGLEINLVVPPSFPVGRFLLSLRGPGSLSADPQAAARALLSQRIWQRGVNLERAISWAALPPGHYSILLRDTAADDPEQSPLELASVTLGSGERKSLRIAIPMASGVAAQQSAVDDLRILLPSGGSSLGDLVATRWRGAESVRVPLKRSVVSGGAIVILHGGCSPGASYLLSSAREIVLPVDTREEDCTRPIRRSLLPSGELVGSVDVPSGSLRPQHARLRVDRCAVAQEALGQPLGTFPIAVAANGAWSLRLPAGCLEAWFETSKFAPEHFHHFDLIAGERRDLGQQHLQHGSALLTRVVDAGTSEAAKGARAELLREADLGRAVRATSAGLPVGAVSAARSGEGGWLRLSGLPVGTFRLRVTAANGLVVFSDPFELREGLETPVEDVVLPAPASLDVFVKLPSALRDQTSNLQVLAQATGERDWLKGMSAIANADQHGVAHFSRLLPGSWRLRVLLRGAGTNSELGQAAIELMPGVAGASTITLEAQVFHGNVTFLSAPISATVDLFPRPRDGRAPASFRTDRDGAFSILLEKGGRYSAHIRQTGGDLEGTMPDAEFADPSQSVELAIPGGGLAGAVVDPQEKPLSGARIEAERLGESAGDVESFVTSERSMTDGTFRFAGLAAGEWVLTASVDGRTSDPLKVTLAAGEQSDNLRLAIADRGKIRGHVLAPNGEPIPGAVGFLTLPAALGTTRYAAFRSGVSGEFDVEGSAAEDPATGPSGNFSVRAYGFPVGTFRRVLSEGALELQLPPVGGRVELLLQEGTWSEFPPNELILVAADGSYTGLAAAGATFAAEGKSALLPSLAAGDWVLARIDSPAAEQAAVAGLGRGLRALARLSVVPDQRTVVAVPTLRPDLAH